MHIDEDEDLQTYGRLFNRDVFALVLRYVLAYKSHLFAALAFVLVITGTNLLVPYLLRTLIDRYISKEGVILDLGARGSETFELNKRLGRGVLLGGGAYFIRQSQLKYLSEAEKSRYRAQGVISDRTFILFEPPVLEGELERKVEDMVAEGRVRVYEEVEGSPRTRGPAWGGGFPGGGGSPGVFPRGRRSSGPFYLIDTDALGGFTVGELTLLRAGDFANILRYVLYIVGALLLQFGASYLQIIKLMKLSQLAMRDLRRDLFSHILSLEVSYFDRTPIGKLVNRVTNDIETLNELFSSVLVTLFQDVLMMAGIALIMFFADFRLALIVSLSYPFIVLFTILFRVQARNAYRLIRTKIAALNSFMNETITGIRIVQIFVQEAHNFTRFLDRNTAVYRAQLKELYANAVFRPLISFLNWFSIALVIYFGARGIVDGRVTFGLLVMFVAYIERFFAPVQDLSEKFDIMQSATAAGEKLIAVFKADAVQEDEGAGALYGAGSPGAADTAGQAGVGVGGGAGGEAGEPPGFESHAAAVGFDGTGRRFRGEIVFEDVWFSYVPGEWVLRGVSFSIKPEQTLAIVGATGAGKTTVINLLAKFQRVVKGRILVDGIDIGDIPYLVLRSNMAAVMQDVFLFSRTVRENITLGRPFDAERFRRVCEATHVDGFIAGLAKGDLEPVMERGATFSAGERQLISFARALYANPSILVLDEATSSIDTQTELLIRDATARLTEGRTSIVIAHRLSTVKDADHIIVLDKGVVVEEGKHRDLLAKKGIYHKLYTLQFDGESRTI